MKYPRVAVGAKFETLIHTINEILIDSKIEQVSSFSIDNDRFEELSHTISNCDLVIINLADFKTDIDTQCQLIRSIKRNVPIIILHYYSATYFQQLINKHNIFDYINHNAVGFQLPIVLASFQYQFTRKIMLK